MAVRFVLVLAALGAIAACARSVPEPANQAATNAASPAPANAVAEAPLEPPAPAEPGGLPDDPTPVSEAPFAETSAQGAANVVQTYYALLEAGRYGEARRLRSEGAGTSPADFAARFRGYREVHALIGAPGRIEGAAGSLFVDVPVQVYGRRANGEPFSSRGTMTLRRVNDVPGSTAEQRRWHISRSDLDPQA